MLAYYTRETLRSERLSPVNYALRQWNTSLSEENTCGQYEKSKLKICLASIYSTANGGRRPSMLNNEYTYPYKYGHAYYGAVARCRKPIQTFSARKQTQHQRLTEYENQTIHWEINHVSDVPALERMSILYRFSVWTTSNKPLWPRTTGAEAPRKISSSQP